MQFSFVLLLFEISTIAVTVTESTQSSADPVAATSYGRVRGYTITAQNGEVVNIFKGIPFAAPPIGNLRWCLPQPPQPWTDIKNATKYSAACMSNSTITTSPQPEVSEDCLYLNVFAGAMCTPESKCDVIVYYHGGGFNFDSAVMFDETFIADIFPAEKFVIVIPAFRLGFTGSILFEDSDYVVPRNLGMHDVVASLKWVQAEIAAFGGDKDRVTIFGHSYGGSIVIFLAMSPGITKHGEPKLFHRVMSMSPENRIEDPKKHLRKAKEFVAMANCTRPTTQETVDCMRKVDGYELLAYQRKLEEKSDRLETFAGIFINSTLFPFTNVAETFKNPVRTPMLLGTSVGEQDSVKANLTDIGVVIGLKNTAELDQIYNLLKKQGKIVSRHKMESQSIYLSVYANAAAMTAAGENCYLYSFDQPTHNKHTDHLSYIMGVHRRFVQDENEQEIAKLYPAIFRSFAATGVPAPDFTPLNKSDAYYSIKVDKKKNRWPEMKLHYEKATIDFWIRKAPRLDALISAAKAAEHGKQRFSLDTEKLLYDLELDQMVPIDNYILQLLLQFAIIILVACIFLAGVLCGRTFYKRRGYKEVMVFFDHPKALYGEKAPLLQQI